MDNQARLLALAALGKKWSGGGDNPELAMQVKQNKEDISKVDEKIDNLKAQGVQQTPLFAESVEWLNENGDTIVVDAHIFDGDALFFPSLKSESAKLVTPEGKDVLRMTYGRVPYLGLWAKPGAPYGICDSENVSGKLEEKPAIVSLEPQREFVFTYEIEILE